MYGSRKVNAKVRFAQNHLEGRLVTGVALGGAGEGLVPRTKSPVISLPKAPPSPTPPSPQPPESSDDDDIDEEDEYTRQLREQNKAKLESITGRMFQVLNDYEGGEGAEVDIGNQVTMIENTELKTNIQLMIADYKEMCVEREDILSSLADWFEEGHVDDLLQEVADRRMSVAADPEGLRKSLLEGKVASEKLKVINEQLEEANSHGLPTSRLKQQKEELEQELMKTKQLVEGEPVKQETEPISTAVKDSWKFAAVEICDLLHQVRDSGLEDIQFMEGKINNLLASMHEQSEVIDKQNDELQLQKQHAVFSDMTTSKLSNDNSLLKEEVDMLRGELLEAKDTIDSMGLDLKTNARELEGLKNKKKTPSAKGKQSLTTEVDKVTAKYEMQLSQLSKQAETLQQEKEVLILECVDLQEQLEEARDLFEEETADHEAEVEMMSTQQQQHSRPLSSDSTKPKQQETPNAVNPTQHTTVSHEGTQSPTPVKPVTLPARKASIQIQNMGTRAERRSLVPHSVDHYRVQLIEKETQLHVAQKETERLTWLLKSMEEEMRKIRRENTELVKLHERSAAVINQASTCLQIKGEQTDEGHHSPSLSEKPVISTPQSFSNTASSPQVVNVISHVDHMKGVSQEHQNHVTVPSPAANLNVSEVPVRVSSPIPLRPSHRDTVPPTQSSHSDPPPSYWSVMGSIDTKNSLKEMAKTNQDESIQLVLSLLEKVNANQSDFATADSKALNKVHTELQNVCQVIKRFLEYSTDIVYKEAEVVSSAVDSLMTQLPEDEKPNITSTTGKSSLQTRRQSIYEANYADRKVLKERVVHFADQAIEVLKAGERVLTTKINSQQKNLQTVLHAMEEHKRRQSHAFRFEAPDVKGLVLEAHAVSSHTINEEQEQKKRDNKRDKLEILRQYAARSLANSQVQRRAGYPLRGLHNGLFGLNLTPFSFGGMGAAMGVADSRRTGKNEPFDVVSPRQQFNVLQINTTHHEQPKATQQSFSYSVGPNTQQQGTYHSQTGQPDHRVNATKKNHRKPKLYKPFHYSEPMSGSSYTPPMTAPAGTRGREASKMRTGVPQSRAGTSHKKKIVFMNEKNAGAADRSYPAQTGNLTTFNNILNYPGNVSKSQNHTVTHGDSTGVKLPPISKS